MNTFEEDLNDVKGSRLDPVTKGFCPDCHKFLNKYYGHKPECKHATPEDFHKSIIQANKEITLTRARAKHWLTEVRLMHGKLAMLKHENNKLRAANKKGNWRPIKTLTLNAGAVLIFDKNWIDSDFNPQGVREGFRNESDTGPIFSARWDSCAECWQTDVNYEGTCWMPLPEHRQENQKP